MNSIQRNNFKNLPLCDTHFHLTTPQTVDDTVKIFSEIMEYFGLSRINMHCINCGSGHRSIDFTNSIKGLYVRERLNSEKENSAFVYGSFSHMFNDSDTADSYLKQVQKLYEMGFDGLKMLEGKPAFRKKLGHSLCDPVFDKAFAFMEENGFPVKMHLGDPYTAWGPIDTIDSYSLTRGWWYGDGTYPSFEELHEEVYGIMKKFPKLKLCIAHFFFLGHKLSEARSFLETWENTSLDLTPGAEMFKGFTENYDEAQRFFADFSDRIYFGSDTYNDTVEGTSPEKYENSCRRISLVRHCLEKKASDEITEGHLGVLRPLELPEDILRKIYFDNHAKLHPSARKVNRALAKDHATELLDVIKQPFYDYGGVGALELETGNLNTIAEYFS